MHVRKSRLQAQDWDSKVPRRPIALLAAGENVVDWAQLKRVAGSRVFLDQTSDEDDDPWCLPTLYGLTRLWIRLVRSGPFGWCSRWVAVPVAFFRPGSLVPMSVS